MYYLGICAPGAGKIEGRLELLIQATLSYGPRQTKKAGTGSGFLFSCEFTNST